jgi:hypothetical protein
LRIASAFAKSSRPFNNVQKPILFVRKRSGDEDGLRTRELNPSVRFNSKQLSWPEANGGGGRF